MDKREFTLQETALFLMDHTDWKTKKLTIGDYMTAIAFLPQVQKPLIDENSAVKQLEEIKAELANDDDWESFLSKVDKMVYSDSVPPTFVNHLYEFEEWPEKGGSIDGLVHQCYEEWYAKPFWEVYKLVGGVNVMNDIVTFALKHASRDDEYVYSELRKKFGGESWYIVAN